MKLYGIFTLLFVLILLSCNSDTSDACRTIRYNEKFQAKVGKIYCIYDNNTLIINKIENNLCPCNADCIWEGEFILHMDIVVNGNSFSFVMGTSDKSSEVQPFDAFKVRFLSISPDQCNSINQSDFNVGLVLEK